MSKKTTMMLVAVALTVAAQSAHAGAPPEVPDAGSTSLLLSAALFSLAGVRRFFSKKG